MSGDKRSVTTDALDTLGMIIGDDEKRDAIHLAVEPVIAGGMLRPGQDVSFKDGVAYHTGDFVGIVDPFLKQNVNTGERFWLVVYPRQIKSLRHVWEHPAFPVSTDVPTVVDDKQASINWMMAWAKEHTSEDYYGDYDVPLSDERAYDNAIRAGENLHIGPYEDARDHIDDVWWNHWEKITGRKGERGSYFSCSC